MSLKKNITYNLLLTVTGFLLNFITFPYLTRILGVQNIGVVNFVDSIFNYGIMLSMLGIGSVGIREISKNKLNDFDLNQSFLNIFLLNLLFTVFSILLLSVCIFTIPLFSNYKSFLGLSLIKILLNSLLIEWFFKGIENFRYVTIRSILVKILYSFAIFYFIDKDTDVYLYYLLSVLVLLINVIFNWTFLFSNYRFKIVKVNIFKYLYNVSVLGGYLLITSMYTTFNVLYLGFVAGDTEVGLYSTATKLYTIFLAIYTAFTGVMLPRMSSLYQEGNIEAFKTLIKKSTQGLLLFSFPLLIFTTVFAPEIIYIIAGKGYEGAVVPMRIVMPLLFVIGYEQILVLQILMPMKKDKEVLRNSIFGAALSLILNFLLVPYLFGIGSSIVWVASEILILVLSQIVVKKVIKIGFPIFTFFRELLVAIPAVVCCLLIKKYLPFQGYLVLFLGLSFLGFYYLIVQSYLLKNELLGMLIVNLKNRTKLNH